MKGNEKSRPQEGGSYHSKKDIIHASTLNYNEKIDVGFLYDLCRATCNKDNGFIISRDGCRYLIKIKDIQKIK